MCFHDYVHHLKYHEMEGHFQVIGITSNTDGLHSARGYRFIPKSNIMDLDFDLICIMAYESTYKSILTEAISLGIPNEIIFSYRVLLNDNLDMNKYAQLKKNPPTIFANQCFGGLAYHNLDLPFTSPFINMFLLPEDYFKFLETPRKYINATPYFSHMQLEIHTNKLFPVARCDDILLYFNHSSNIEEALTCWNRRKARIDWDNILISFASICEADIERFEHIPYKKKVCLTTLDIQKPYILHFNSKYITFNDISFWQYIQHPSSYFDMLELLYSGKIHYCCK